MGIVRREHNPNCKGGYSIKEVNGKNYCYGRVKCGYDFVVFADECQECSRLLDNCEEEINAWIAERSEE